MSLASVGYREVYNIISTWTEKYQYHISLLDSLEQSVRFMVDFSLTSPSKPVPVSTVKVYFTCRIVESQLEVTFRFEKDSLIHSASKTIRHGEIYKWLDDTLAKKLLLRDKLFYLGTAYEATRVKDPRQDKVLAEHKPDPEVEYVYLAPYLLSDFTVLPEREALVMQPDDYAAECFNTHDPFRIKVITQAEFAALLTEMGLHIQPNEMKQLLKRVDPEETGLVEYDMFKYFSLEIFEAKMAKKYADRKLAERKEEYLFASSLALVTDEAQDVEDEMLTMFVAKDEDEKGFSNISEVKAVLEAVSNNPKRKPFLTAIELTYLSKILTDKYGYKDIPYRKIHSHLIDLKMLNYATGRMNSNVGHLEGYLREILDASDYKKTGRITLEKCLTALSSCEKIKLTKSQLYLIESVVPVDNKGEFNYVETCKQLAEIILKIYLKSSQKK